MNSPLLNSLHEQLDSAHEQYNLHFAGQMRTTRSTHMMKLMIEAVEAIKRDTTRIEANGDGEQRQQLLQLCGERLDLYRGELTAIEKARADAGEDGVEAALLGTRANFVFHRYNRHYAGKSRGTRDIGLLLEMRNELRTIREQMLQIDEQSDDDGMDHDLGVITEFLELFASEEQSIIGARDAGTMEEQAGTLAELANGQFALYAQHFAGHPRVSRRPELLQRMIDSLQSTLARMQGLQSIGHHTDNNADNIAIVQDRLNAWQSELRAIQEQRQQTPLLAMVEALGEAVDPILNVYNENFAGQSRNNRDMELLSVLCDALAEIEGQMERIGSVDRLTANERNLHMVRDALVMFEREWQAIAESQAE